VINQFAFIRASITCAKFLSTFLALLRVLVPLVFIIFSSAGTGLASTSPPFIIEDGNASVHFDVSQEAAAREVLRLYPIVRSDLEKLMEWRVEFRPTLILMKEGEVEKMAGTRLVAALAIPEHNLMLFDLSKMVRHAFVLETTMKHELCHLLLHYYIPGPKFPKWLDEGVCQWASNGMAEIIFNGKSSLLDEAVVAGKIMPLSQLDERFPEEDRPLILAYQQSESIVAYVAREYGTQKLLLILKKVRDGAAVQDALKESIGISVLELESNWRRSLKKEHTLLVYVSVHLYEILFFIAALLALGGSIRLMRRRKSRLISQEEEGEEDTNE
jgi:hypothetical protein